MIPTPIIWLMGLSAVGKTTTANFIAKELESGGEKVHLLDGDDIRKVFPTGFTKDDIVAHIRRVIYIANILNNHNIIVVASFITACKEAQQIVREMINPERLLFVHLDCPLDELKKRDTKGIYKKGHIKFDSPEGADIFCVDTLRNSPMNVCRKIILKLKETREEA